MGCASKEAKSSEGTDPKSLSMRVETSARDDTGHRFNSELRNV